MSFIQMSVSAACMIAVISIIRFTAIHRLPKKLMLLLWAVVLCRMLIPFSIPAEISVFNYTDTVIQKLSENSMPIPFAENTESKIQKTTEIHATAVQERPAPFKQGGQTTVTGSGGDFAYYIAPEPFTATPIATPGEESILPLMLIWLTGALTAIAFFAVSFSRYRKKFRDSQPVNNFYVSAWKERHKPKRPCQVHITDGISTPLTYGIFRPIIMMPSHFDWADEEKLDYILTHEFIHISRFDALTKLLSTAAACVHWFNPFVWLMVILYNRDIEISCDESVIKAIGAGSKSAYALTLIEMVEKGNKPTPLFSGFSRHAIEDRVKSIVELRKPSVVATLAAVITIVVAIAVFVTSAQDKTATVADMETYITRDGDSAPAYDYAKDVQTDDMIEPESAENTFHSLLNDTSAEAIIPMDMDELNGLYDFSKLGTIFSPDSLYDSGGSLLFDEYYSYTVQFPEEWFFTGSTALSEAMLAFCTTAVENQNLVAFAESIGQEDIAPPEIELAIDNFHYPAVFTKIRYPANSDFVISVLSDNFINVYYRNSSPSLTSFDEVARLVWASHYARIIGVGGEASHLGELEAINMDGVDAYRFSIRIDFSEYGGGLRLEHEYLIPLADNGIAVFSMALHDTDADNAEFTKFHRAMETFAWRQ